MGNSIAAVAAVVFGLAVGSFLNVLIVRLPASERITGRSRCPRCRKPIAWFHNVPVLSYLFLGGRCAHCKKRISWQYPAVELATALLFMLVAMKYFFLYELPKTLGLAERLLSTDGLTADATADTFTD